MDVFSDLRLTRSRSLSSTLTAPWGLRVPNCGRALFHFVAEGSCLIRVGDAAEAMEKEDFVLVPHGVEHDLLDAIDSNVEVVSSLPSEEVSALGWNLSYGGGGARSVMISGSFAFKPHPVVSELPTTILVRRAETGHETQIARVVASLVDEVAVARPGSETVVNRLVDVLVIAAIRSWVDEADSHGGWLGALHHDGLGRALALIHTDAERAWTLGELAAEAGMSRASFAKEFAERIGTPPVQFLSQRRMELATRWLRADALTISEVSERLGYSSEAAFSRAFKRFTGFTPGAAARGLTD